MPKKKGTPGGNPQPVQTPEFLAKQFAPAADLPAGVELAKAALCVKLPADIDSLVRPLENRSEWLRRVIVEAARRELMNTQNEEVNGSDS
jgi:hypothetical protein